MDVLTAALAASRPERRLPCRRAMLRKPVILRFATDTFMDDFAQLLETDPSRLLELVAIPETWRGPVRLSPPHNQRRSSRAS